MKKLAKQCLPFKATVVVIVSSYTLHDSESLGVPMAVQRVGSLFGAFTSCQQGVLERASSVSGRSQKEARAFLLLNSSLSSCPWTSRWCGKYEKRSVSLCTESVVRTGTQQAPALPLIREPGQFPSTLRGHAGAIALRFSNLSWAASRGADGSLWVY